MAHLATPEGIPVTMEDLVVFVDRVHAVLSGQRQGMQLRELMCRLATERDPAEAIQSRLHMWARADCRDTHGLGFYQARFRAHIFVYLLSDPFHPPPQELPVAQREKRKHRA